MRHGHTEERAAACCAVVGASSLANRHASLVGTKTALIFVIVGQALTMEQQVCTLVVSSKLCDGIIPTVAGKLEGAMGGASGF